VITTRTSRSGRDKAQVIVDEARRRRSAKVYAK